MKTVPSDRSIPKLRPLRSLYRENAAQGKREGTPIKVMDRKSMFKPRQNTGILRKNISVPAKNVVRRIHGGINSNDSARMSRALNLGGATGKCSHLNGMFLRPSIDVRSFHQKIMERARQLGETLQNEEGQSKSVNRAIMKLPSNGTCSTPKPSGLSRAYIKLSESRKKSGLLKKAVPSATFSPFEERIIQKEGSGETSKVPVINGENILSSNSITHSKTSPDAKVKASDSPWNVVSDAENLSKKFSSNIEKEIGKSEIQNENYSKCALSNILKHCQLYSGNMMNIGNAMNVLDETFQRVMVAEIGGRLRATFSDYQNRKLELYKKMEQSEEELEKSVKDEVDIPLKFNDYLTKRRNIMKAHRDLQENFENYINQIIENCGKEMSEPAKCERVEDVMNGLVSGKASPRVERGEPTTLRRSQRLLTTPRISDAEPEKTRTTPTRRMRRRSTQKDCEMKGELVVKRRSKSYDKKRIQTCIYKDLQKSFNLCSPECSF